MVDNSTTSPETAREVSMLLAQQNVGFLDAPVTGAPQRAANGTLTVMVGRLRRMKYGICGLLLHACGIFFKIKTYSPSHWVAWFAGDIVNFTRT